jgi:hypothetical protein
MQRRRIMRGSLAATLIALAGSARADEGMWTLENFPKEKVEQKYGFRPDDAWLKHVELASARIAGGCSASFVSPHGLVVTNHHCAHACMEQLSNARQDFVKNGFYAASEADERHCPAMEIDQLVAITDVTSTMNQATAGLSGEKYVAAQRAATARLERDCQKAADVRCDVVSLYHGGIYKLYQYKRYQDVRLVFGPELAVAFFGGDVDNFMFPRYDLDVAFLRVYEGGKPAATEAYFPWSAAGPKAGELTFVSGNPGRTARELTVSELAYQRDVALPERLCYLAELRGILTEFQRRGAEEKRFSTDLLFMVENSYKALGGMVEALRSERFFESKVAAQEALIARLEKSPQSARAFVPAFAAIAAAEQHLREIHVPLRYIEEGVGFQSQLYRYARTIVRGVTELQKPDEERLPEFHQAALPELEADLFSTAPVHKKLEEVTLEYSLTKLRASLGPDDAFVRQVLGKQSPAELARQVVQGTRLDDPMVRRKLWKAGWAAIEASKDPMIALARLVDPDARAIRKKYDDEVKAVIGKNQELIAKARFAVEGTTTYPDATFTLRLSYGAVKGWREGTREIQPFTTIGGAFARATGRDPFALPKSWLEAKPRLDLATPLDFCTDNDIIGGNSGSPVLNRRAELVGLIFDGNIHSLGGNYGFDEANNRAVAVDTTAIGEALTKVYGAHRLATELMPLRSRAER